MGKAATEVVDLQREVVTLQRDLLAEKDRHKHLPKAKRPIGCDPVARAARAMCYTSSPNQVLTCLTLSDPHSKLHLTRCLRTLCTSGGRARRARRALVRVIRSESPCLGSPEKPRSPARIPTI